MILIQSVTTKRIISSVLDQPAAEMPTEQALRKRRKRVALEPEIEAVGGIEDENPSSETQVRISGRVRKRSRLLEG